MGQDELVLKIPGATSPSPPPPPAAAVATTARAAAEGASPPSASGLAASSAAGVPLTALKRGGGGKQMTHSRESSGASVKFVSSARSSNTGYGPLNRVSNFQRNCHQTDMIE